MPAMTARIMVWNWSNCGPASGSSPRTPCVSLQRSQASGTVTWRSSVQRATSCGLRIGTSAAPPRGAIKATWLPER